MLNKQLGILSDNIAFIDLFCFDFCIYNNLFLSDWFYN